MAVRATAASSSLVGNPVFNPVTTSANPCVSNATGADALPDSVGAPSNAITAKTSSATTFANPGSEIPARQAIGAIGRVESLAIQLPPGQGTLTLGLRVANATANGVCVGAAPVLDGSSQIDGLSSPARRASASAARCATRRARRPSTATRRAPDRRLRRACSPTACAAAPAHG
jgi:hypothetical protein